MVHIHTVKLSLVVSLVRKRGKNRPTSTPPLSTSTFLLYISYSLSCGLNLHTIILCCTPDEQSAKRQQRVNIEKTEVPQHPFLYNCIVSDCARASQSKPRHTSHPQATPLHNCHRLFPPPLLLSCCIIYKAQTSTRYSATPFTSLLLATPSAACTQRLSFNHDAQNTLRLRPLLPPTRLADGHVCISFQPTAP